MDSGVQEASVTMIKSQPLQTRTENTKLSEEQLMGAASETEIRIEEFLICLLPLIFVRMI